MCFTSEVVILCLSFTVLPNLQHHRRECRVDVIDLLDVVIFGEWTSPSSHKKGRMEPTVAGTLDTTSLYHRPRAEISGIKPVKHKSIPFHSPQRCGSFSQWTTPKKLSQTYLKTRSSESFKVAWIWRANATQSNEIHCVTLRKVVILIYPGEPQILCFHVCFFLSSWMWNWS